MLFYLYELEDIEMSDNKTQLATFRIESELWDGFKAQARRNGKTASDVLNEFVRAYVEKAEPIPSQIDNLDELIDDKIEDVVSPIRAELAELKTLLGKYQRAA